MRSPNSATGIQPSAVRDPRVGKSEAVGEYNNLSAGGGGAQLAENHCAEKIAAMSSARAEANIGFGPRRAGNGCPRPRPHTDLGDQTGSAVRPGHRPVRRSLTLQSTSLAARVWLPHHSAGDSTRHQIDNAQRPAGWGSNARPIPRRPGEPSPDQAQAKPGRHQSLADRSIGDFIVHGQLRCSIIRVGRNKRSAVTAPMPPGLPRACVK